MIIWRPTVFCLLSILVMLSTSTLTDTSVAAGARLEWPRASLPRPVKKLSWPGSGDDQDREISTYHYTDPALAVTPAPRQLTLAPGSRHSGTQLEHF